MTKEDIKQVMLVDDNPTDRFIHTKLLNIYSIGEKTVEFPAGKEALQFFKENKQNADALPDLLLLDVLMPEMNGFDFLIHFENIYEDLVKKPLVFMLSSTDDELDLRRARNNKLVQKMLRKPFSPDALTNALSEL